MPDIGIGREVKALFTPPPVGVVDVLVGEHLGHMIHVVSVAERLSLAGAVVRRRFPRG